MHKPLKYYINYADDNLDFKRLQKRGLRFAKWAGGFDKVIGYGREDIDEVFYSNNQSTLEQKRGGGYWLWKPYMIDKTMEILKNGDYLFYADATCLL